MPHNAVVARSGVQYYTRAELVNLGLTSIPREHKGNAVFGVYRSADCLMRAMPLFNLVPVVPDHTKWVGDGDARVIGKADKPNLHVLTGERKGEVCLNMVLTLTDEAVLKEKRELSPGYSAKYRWQNGVSPYGEEFQLVCERILDVNHIALVPEARGGKEMRVLDGGTHVKKILSGLLWFAKNHKKVADAQGDPFMSTLEDFKKNVKMWSDEELTEHVNTLSALLAPLPDSEEKAKLTRFVADLPLLKAEDDATIDTALSTVSEFYTALTQDAVTDVLGTEQKEESGTPAPLPAAKPEGKAVEADNSAAKPEDPVCAALTAINEKLDKLLAVEKQEAAGKEKDAGEAEEKKSDDKKPTEQPAVKEEKEKTKVGDEMPLFNQTMNTVNQGNDLDALFAKMKERK